VSLDETRCPSCGRFVGAYEKCPYCGATVSKRMSIKIFRYGSLILSFVGLAILYLISVHKEIPLVKVADISPTMNFAYIRVRGIVYRYPMFDEKLYSLTVHLNDGTDDIMIKAYRVTGLKLKELNKLPKLGDIMDVEGTVRIRGNTKILTINVPERVKIIEVSAKRIKLSEISDSFLNRKVTIIGYVYDIRYYRKYISLYIADIKGKNRVRVPINLNNIENNFGKLQVGYKVRINGVLSYYSKSYNIVPISSKDIIILSKRLNIPYYKLNEITSDDIDRMITTKGEIIKIRKFSKGVSLTISDNNENIDVVLWNNVYNSIPNQDDIVEGTKVKITGKIGIYRGRLQIVPKTSAQFKIIKKAGTEEEEVIKPTPPVKKKITAIKIANISTNDIGKIIKIKGKITDFYDFSKGRRITLDDGTASIDVILWNDLLNSIPEAEYLRADSEIAVTGKVGIYRDNLQVVPKYSDNVEIIKIGSPENNISTNVTETNR